MAFTENTAGGVVYMTAPTITAKHAFTTRAGGVSSGAFSSLNLSFGRGDPAENVTENYCRLGAALGVDAFFRGVYEAGARRGGPRLHGG
jgi:copper oxidase (laccase) domain-containing protein